MRSFETEMMWILLALIIAIVSWMAWMTSAGRKRSSAIAQLEARLEAALKRRLEALGPQEAVFDQLRALTVRPVAEGVRRWTKHIMFKDDSQLCCELISQEERDEQQLRCVARAPREGSDALELRADDQGATITWRAHTLAIKTPSFKQLCHMLDLRSTSLLALVFDQHQALVSLESSLPEDASTLEALTEHLWDESCRLAQGWAKLTDEQLLVWSIEMLARFDHEVELAPLHFMEALILDKPELQPRRDELIYAQVEAGNPYAVCAALLLFGEPLALSAPHARQLWELVEQHPLRQQIVAACPVQFADAAAQAPRLSKLATSFLLELARQEERERFEALVSPVFQQDHELQNLESLNLICKDPPELAWARLVLAYPLAHAAREKMPIVGALDVSELWQKLLWMWRQCWPLSSESQRDELRAWLEQVCLRFAQGALARHGSSAAMTLDAVAMLAEFGDINTLKTLATIRQNSPSSAMVSKATALLTALQKRLIAQGAHIPGALSLSDHTGVSGGLSLLDEAQQGQLSILSDD